MQPPNDHQNRIMGIQRRVAFAYGITVLYILIATFVGIALDLRDNITARVILAAGAALLAIRAVLMDLSSQDENNTSS